MALSNLRKLYKDLNDILLKGKISKKGEKCFKQFNFIGEVDEEFNIENRVIKKLPEINKFKNNIIINFYSLLGDSELEWFYKDVTFMSWNSVLHFYNFKKEQNQHDILDFGITYIGMGHIYVYFIDLNNNKIYKRKDGGSNGYERFKRFEKICLWKNNNSEKDNEITNELDIIEIEFNSLF